MKKIFILLVLLVPTLSIWAAPDQLTNPAQAGAYWTLSCYSGNGSTNVDAVETYWSGYMGPNHNQNGAWGNPCATTGDNIPIVYNDWAARQTRYHPETGHYVYTPGSQFCYDPDNNTETNNNVCYTSAGSNTYVVDSYAWSEDIGWSYGAGWTKWALRTARVASTTIESMQYATFGRGVAGWNFRAYWSNNDWNAVWGCAMNPGDYTSGNESPRTYLTFTASPQSTCGGFTGDRPSMFRLEVHSSSGALGADSQYFGIMGSYNWLATINDNAVPTISASPPGGWTSGVVSSPVTFSDNVGVENAVIGSSNLWLWAVDAACNYWGTIKPCADWSGTPSYDTNAVVPPGYSNSGQRALPDGYNQLNYLVNDAGGNQATTSRTIAVDNSAGSVSSNLCSTSTVGSGDCAWKGPAAAPFTITGADGLSGVSSTSYSASSAIFVGGLTSGTSAAGTPSTVSGSVNSCGKKQISYSSVNGSGLTATGSGYRFFDNCAPTDSTVTPSSAWRSSGATFATNCSDAESGLKDTYYQVNSGAWGSTTGNTSFAVSGGGTTTLGWYCTDNLGNQSATRTAPINIDNSIPVVAPAVASGVSGACPSGWQPTSVVNCSVTATDTYSGLDPLTTFKWSKNGVAQANAPMTEGNITATGGTTSDITDGGVAYRVHKFTTAGPSPFNVTSAPAGAQLEYLVVAGGGGGGSFGGGGGAGGMLSGSQSFSTGVYVVTVGSGGAGQATSNIGVTGLNGSNSIFASGSSTITAVGGGGGGSRAAPPGYVAKAGDSGGSGGGSSSGDTGTQPVVGAGTVGQGSAGGLGLIGQYIHGGGGGASQVGANAVAGAAGKGGNGLASTISGSSVTYAGGGGAGNIYQTATVGAGGSGGGGSGGSPGVAGTANSGGGGGGGAYTTAGGAGGSGTVIIRYKIGPYLSASATIPCTGEGINNITATAQDAVGNVSANTIVGTCKIDLSNPAGSVTDPSPDTSYIRAPFTPTGTATDSGSGVGSAVIQKSFDSGASWSDFTGCSAQSPVGEGVTSARVICDPYTPAGVAGSSLQMRVKTTDFVGNNGYSTVLANTLDMTKPVTAVIDPSTSSQWLRGTFVPTGTITDATSGSTSSGNAIQEGLNSAAPADFADLPGCNQTSNQVTCSSYNTANKTSGTVQNLRMRGIDQARNDDYSAAVLADNPLGYWTLSDSQTSRVLDDGSRSNDLVANGVVTAGAGGPPTLGNPKAFSFTAGSLSSSTSPRGLNPSGAFTIEAWIKTSDTSKDLISGTSYNLAVDGAGKAKGSVKIAGVWTNITGGQTINDNKWNLVQFSYDASNMKLYTNGTLDGTVAKTGSLDASTAAMIVAQTGVSAGGGASYYNGSLAQIAFYGSALSATQLNNHYISQPLQVSNTLDNDAPALTFTPQSGKSSDGWYNTSPVTSLVSAPDPVSGTKTISWQDNGASASGSPLSASSGSIAISGTGTHNLSITAEDNAGNIINKTIADSADYSIKIDLVAPTLTNPCPTAWNNLNIVCTLSTGADNLSGIKYYRYRSADNSGNPTSSWTTVSPGATLTISQEGVTYWQIQAQDRADNYSTTYTATTRLDKTAPNGGRPVSSLRYISGTKVLQNPTASDSISGIKQVDYRFSTTGSSGSYTTSDCLAVTSQTPYSCSFNSTTRPDGDYFLAALVTDNADNTAWSANSVDKVYIDNTLPTTGALTLPTPAPGTNGSGQPIYRGSLLTSTTAQDSGSGIGNVKVQYRVGSGAWSDAPTNCDNMASTGGTMYGCSLVTTSIPDGTYGVRAAATDRAGNLGGGAERTIVIDNGPPIVTLENIASYLNGSVPLAASATDAGSGVASIEIQVAPHGTTVFTAADPSCRAAAASVSCYFNSLAYSEGTRLDFRATATDAAGNVGVSSIRSDRMIDNTAPSEVISGFSSVWRNTDLSVSLTGTDGGSGINQASYKFSVGLTCPPTAPTTTNAPASFAISTEGVIILCSRVSDNVGNWSQWIERTARIDKTIPITTIDGVPTDWTNQDPNIAIVGADQPGLSGIDKSYWTVDGGSTQSGPNGTGPLITSSGTYAIVGYNTDNASNRSVNKTATLKLDKVKPINTTNATGDWSQAQVPVTISGTDALSGVQSVAWKISENGTVTERSGDTAVATITNEGRNQLYTRITDRAGNVSDWKLSEVLIDKTDPAFSASGSSDQWYNTNRSIVLSATDTGGAGLSKIEWQSCSDSLCSSGTDSGSYTDVTNGSVAKTGNSASHTLSFTSEGDRTLRVRSQDSAGRTSSWETIHVRIDKTAPEITMGGTPARVTDVIGLNAVASDSGGSGLSSGYFQICRSTDCSTEAAVWTTINQLAAAGIDPPLCGPEMQLGNGTYSCNFDTKRYSDGEYSLRAGTSDAAGNITFSNPLLNGQRIRNGNICPVDLTP